MLDNPRVPQLRALLESLPQEKWVFTNCNEKHCRIALGLLGLQVTHPVTAPAHGSAALREPAYARHLANTGTRYIPEGHACPCTC